ncbi:MFS transporter [Mesorhizobium caraganae]|uniref:MFS transporter n=1 Tax=Mesorhizobium caraganae TaxID=483206 RepID=UPI0028A0B154|nr:MFS transporter [Mesorhizobium caraganae]
MVQAWSNLPAFILSVFARALVDIFSRRRVMFAGRCLMVIASAMLTALVPPGFVDPRIIFGLMIACGGALNDSASQASVCDMVERCEVPAAVTFLSVGFNTVRNLEPSTRRHRGCLVRASGGLAVTTLSYLVALGTIWRCKWKVRSSALPRELRERQSKMGCASRRCHPKSRRDRPWQALPFWRCCWLSARIGRRTARLWHNDGRLRETRCLRRHLQQHVQM